MPCIPKDSWRPGCPWQSEGEEEQQRGEDGDGGGSPALAAETDVGGWPGPSGGAARQPHRIPLLP